MDRTHLKETYGMGVHQMIKSPPSTLGQIGCTI
uniref:Uncharacterized protein n=1 Tax=Rhizophora mucronata TaxID=61149 RepID=A0A2P2JWW5_RHIMU